MDTTKRIVLKQNERVKFCIGSQKEPFCRGLRKIVDSDALWITPRRDPQTLDNCSAVAHTTHNTTTAILEIKPGKEGNTVDYHWGEIIVVTGEK